MHNNIHIFIPYPKYIFLTCNKKQKEKMYMQNTSFKFYIYDLFKKILKV